MMCEGLGQISCPQRALMDPEHFANQSIKTSEQKSHNKHGVKDTLCILFLTTDCSSFCMKTVRHFPQKNTFLFESYKCFCQCDGSELLIGWWSLSKN